MINSAVAAGALQRRNILRSFNDANRLFVAAVVTAYRALLRIGEILTDIAAMHAFTRFEYLRCEKLHIFYRLIEHEISETLGSLHSYAG